MIIWSKLPKIDLTIAAAISLETAGFIGNIYSSLCFHLYVHNCIFYHILISLDAVKNKKIVDVIIPKKIILDLLNLKLKLKIR